MKRLILLFLPFVSVFINAEELKFVTVLSSPVGTFNKLEAVNPAVPAKSPTINFCTSIGNGGTVTLQAKDAAKHPTMNTVNMSSNTELGGNGGNYVLSRITMNKGGVLQGSRLLANTLQVGQSTSGKSENLYMDNLTVAGAKTGKLYVNGTESYIETSHADPGMVWSNQYQNDKACGSTAECSKQYLLKQKGGSTPSTCNQQLAAACETDLIENKPGFWNEATCSCTCPAGLVLDAHGYCGCPQDTYFIEMVNGVYFGECDNCHAPNPMLHLSEIKRYCEEFKPLYAEDWGGRWNPETCSCDCTGGMRNYTAPNSNPVFRACVRYDQGGGGEVDCIGPDCEEDRE